MSPEAVDPVKTSTGNESIKADQGKILIFEVHRNYSSILILQLKGIHHGQDERNNPIKPDVQYINFGQEDQMVINQNSNSYSTQVNS